MVTLIAAVKKFVDPPHSLLGGGVAVGFSQRWDFITPFISSAALYSHWEILNVDSESFNERGDVR